MKRGFCWFLQLLFCHYGRTAGASLSAPVINMTYEVVPRILQPDQVRSNARTKEVFSVFAAHEAQTADDQARAAAEMEGAAQAQLVASQKALESQLIKKNAIRSSQRTQAMLRQAQAIAMSTQQLVDEMPSRVERSVQQAVEEVKASAIAQMNAEVKQTIDYATSIDTNAQDFAANAAQEAAYPFQQAKLRAGQAMYSYAYQARELANAVTQLKKKSIEIANEALPLQRNGNVVVAQRLRMQAADLMDKALQMQDQAKSFHKTASKIGGELGSYDLAADGAAAYGAYQGNPHGVRNEWPKPPEPLTLPLFAGGPGPAPAPALAPALAPAIR